MAYRGPIDRSGLRTALSALIPLSILLPPSLALTDETAAQTQLPGYAQAQDAFMRLTVDERVKLQVVLTAAGYWPAVPDADFSTRLFDAILKFEVDNGFVPLGVLNDQQFDRLSSIAAPYLNSWRFELIRHPMTNSQIWVPIGLPIHPARILRVLVQQTRAERRQDLLFKTIPERILRLFLFRRDHGRLCPLSPGRTWRRRLQSLLEPCRDGIERIATLISGSLWSSESGAPFTSPFTVRTGAPEAAATPGPSPAPQPLPTAPEPAAPHTSSSGTGIFVTNEGHIVTNAHVVKDCSEIRVGMGQGNFEAARLVAKDPTNDLALLKVNAKPARVGALRFGARQGENVEAFGYPLSDVLATSGNFTTGIVTALAGIGDDSRFYQISAPVQPGNSGGPLLDENGNLIGVVSSKLNFLSEIKNAGDIPQNVNFAIKASSIANFLRDNAIKFQIGEATQAMKGPDLADQAKAMSAFIVCR